MARRSMTRGQATAAAEQRSAAGRAARADAAAERASSEGRDNRYLNAGRTVFQGRTQGFDIHGQPQEGIQDRRYLALLPAEGVKALAALKPEGWMGPGPGQGNPAYVINLFVPSVDEELQDIIELLSAEDGNEMNLSPAITQVVGKLTVIAGVEGVANVVGQVIEALGSIQQKLGAVESARRVADTALARMQSRSNPRLSLRVPSGDYAKVSDAFGAD